jgi:hypothetical protein
MVLRRWAPAALLLALLLAALAGPTVAAGAASTSTDATGSSPGPDTAAASAGPSPATSASASAAPTAFVLPFTFNENAYTVADLAPLEQPLSAATAAHLDTGVHDSSGVRMWRAGGVLYNYPGAAAKYGLANLNTYRDTLDTFYLQRAEAQAQRLVDIHVEAAAPGGAVAWYFPNLYPRYRHDLHKGNLIEPPWYSAMAQGLALALFSRLEETTGVQTWGDAATHTLASYLRPGPRSGPYTVDVDSAGYYWLQEWPWPHMKPDDTLNGHNYSTFGLYEYYELTGDQTALELFRGAVTTTEHYFPDFRNPGWISHYCLADRANNAKYHGLHIEQLLQIYTITQDPTFAHFADLLESDYPTPAVSGIAHLCAGTYAAYRFAGRGVIVGHKTFTLTRSRSVPVDLRQRIRTRGIFFKAARGNLAGYWLKEVPGRAYLPGIVVPLTYTPARTVQLAAGSTYTAVSIATSGRVLASVALAGGGSVLVDRGAVVNGYHSVRISDDALDGGALNGYWLTLGKGVTLQ